MKWAIGIGVLAAMLVIGTTIPPAAGSSVFGSDAEQVGDLETDLVFIQATVSDDGVTNFSIQYAIELADDNESQAFDDLAADIRQNESTYLHRFAKRMNTTVEAAEATTGRNMTIGDFDVSTNRTTLGKEYGLVTYSATWTRFANATGDQLQIGDALAGLFIDRDTRFVIQYSETHQLESVVPSPTDSTAGEVVWAGPREFDTGEPSVTLVPAVEETEPEPTTQIAGTDEGLSWPLLGIGLAVVLVLAVRWYREAGGPPSDGGDSTGSGSVPSDERITSEGAEAPTDLLSNEERVEQYLESVGGRAKQQEIVEALDWTEAKTSQVLSDMTESDTIEKFRIGRENVVKIPDVDEERE